MCLDFMPSSFCTRAEHEQKDGVQYHQTKPARSLWLEFRGRQIDEAKELGIYSLVDKWDADPQCDDDVGVFPSMY